MAPKSSKSSKKQHKVSDSEDERDIPDRSRSPHKALNTSSKPREGSKSSAPQGEDEQERRLKLRYNQPIVEKIHYRLQVKALVSTGLYTTAKARELIRLQKAHPDRTASVSNGKKKAFCEKMSSINPYEPFPRNGKAPIVLGSGASSETIVPQKIRFDDNHIFCIEHIPLVEKGSNNVNNSFPGWSIKRVPLGEPDEREYVAHDGKIKKRFNFSGTMKSLNDLHTGLKFLKKHTDWSTLISMEDARAVEEDEHGIVDISTASKPTYCNEIMEFGQHGQYRMFIDRHTYTPPSGNTISYMALIICKKRSETAKKKSTKGGSDEDDHFQIVIPISRLDHLLIAVEMTMEANKIKPIEIIWNKKSEVDEDIENVEEKDAAEEELDDDDEVMLVEKKKNKKKKVEIRKRKHTSSPETDTDVVDSDMDVSEADTASSSDVDEAEEKKRTKRRTARVSKKNKKYE